MPVNKSNKTPSVSTQKYLKIAEIHDDTLVLTDGSVRSVIKTSAQNIDLKSEAEKDGIIYSFQSFLNSLKTPIQILVKSRKLDIEGYVRGVTERADTLEKGLMKTQLYEYADFIRRLVEMSEIMQKDFYVIVPHEPARSQKKNIMENFLYLINPVDTASKFRIRQMEFAALKKILDERTANISNGLGGCGLATERLDTEGLVRLFYESYNPITAHAEKLVSLSDMDLEVGTN